MAANAGLETIEARDRAVLLADVDMLSTLRSLAMLWADLDIARTTNWTDKQVQTRFLASTNAVWAGRLRQRIEGGDFLLTPRGLAQLTREILENASIEGLAEPASAKTLVHLLLSINTEQNRSEDSDDGLASLETIERIRKKVEGMDLDGTTAALREHMVHEVASMLFDAPLKLEVLQGNTQDLWFRDWPHSVTREELGPTPAEAFANANNIDLRDLLVLGHIITKGAKAGRVEFTRDDLIASGAPEVAVAYCLKEMALPLRDYQAKLRADRNRGSIQYQRYTMTQYPFLKVNESTLVMLRYQWAVDRFFGSQLYWPTFSKLPSHRKGKPAAGSAAEAFSLAMNDTFERTVGEVLGNIVANSRRMTRIIGEKELQDTWTERESERASACDWVIPAGPRCFVIDATNHHLDYALAQGLGSVGDYAADMDETFAEPGEKFDQLAKTIENLIDTGESAFGLDPDAVFIPLVVLPDGGVPNLDTTDLDLRIRSAPHFEQFGERTLAPASLTLTDLLLLEGLAERLGSDTRFPDVANLLHKWRRQATRNPWPTSLREIIENDMPGQPIPRRIFRSRTELLRTIGERITHTEQSDAETPARTAQP